MTHFSQEPEYKEINLDWDQDRNVASFEDAELRLCSIGDSSAHGDRAIRFGVVEPNQSTMHLRQQDLAKIIEPLRQFAANGFQIEPQRFRDWNGRWCKLSIGDERNTIIIGVNKNSEGHALDNSLAVLSRNHVMTLLPFLNNFIAHGSVKPDM